MYVVSSLEEKQKAYVVVSVVEHLLTQVSWPANTWEKDMATHSSVLAWRIPGTGEPGGLPSMGSHRVGHD